MALKLFRRHRIECEGGHAEDTKSGEFEEGRRGWKRCACIIHATGTLGGHFSRKQTGKWKWDEAKEVADQWEIAGTWGKVEPTPQAAQTSETAAKRITILEATEAYRAKCKNRSIQPATYAKYKTFTNQLEAYAKDRGCVFVDQLTVADADRFYASWEDGIRAKAKKLDRLKAFVKFCLKRKWLTENIADDLQAPAGSSTINPKAPFTDEELARIYAACDALGPAPGPPRRNWSGEDAKDFIFLSIYTGMRISDVATFDVTKRLKGNSVFLRMHKTKQPLHTWIPDWLAARLQARQEKNGPLIFRCGVSFTMKQLTDIWRNARLNKVFKMAGPWPEPAHPHRLRHTFVRILLEKGVPIADVAELAGDTEAIIKKHYAKWTIGRQDRISRILQDAFSEKPRPVLVKKEAS
jgi:integrase